MKIALLGSTGFVGKVLLKKALDSGYQVKTLVRDPEKLGEFKDRVEFIQGSIFEPDKMEEAVKGTDVAISTVGPPQKKPKNPEKYKTAMDNLITALKKQNIKRFIHIGGAVHPGGENENWTMGRRLLRLFLTLSWKPGLVAKHLEWEVLKESSLDWTLVRPPQIIKGGSTGRVIADEKNLARAKINVEDLSSFILDQINSENWIKKAPLVASER
jgi:putative NADH-flavin reductase